MPCAVYMYITEILDVHVHIRPIVQPTNFDQLEFRAIFCIRIGRYTHRLTDPCLYKIIFYLIFFFFALDKSMHQRKNTK